MECPICEKEFNEKTGRRPKKFCSDACKVKFWNKFKKVQRGEEVVDEKPKLQLNGTKPDVDVKWVKPKTFQELLTEAKNGTLNMTEFENAHLHPNQRDLILRKRILIIPTTT